MERLGRRVVLIPAFAGIAMSHSALDAESMKRTKMETTAAMIPAFAGMTFSHSTLDAESMKRTKMETTAAMIPFRMRVHQQYKPLLNA